MAETPEKNVENQTPAEHKVEKQAQQAGASAKEGATGEQAKPETGEKVEKKPEGELTESASGADAGAEEASEAPAAVRKVKGKQGKAPPTGIAHVTATFNNTIVTITDMQGRVVSWSSAGRAGFKGSRKSTSFAATMVGQDAARQAAGKGMREVEVRVQGAGSGREAAIRAIQSSGLNVTLIKDITPVPHNGCRPRKRRRV